MSKRKMLRATLQAQVDAERLRIARVYFAKHPTATRFTREATAQELRLFGFPPGTVVWCQKVGSVAYLQGYVPPNPAYN
jgi:hypothetical protein